MFLDTFLINGDGGLKTKGNTKIRIRACVNNILTDMPTDTVLMYWK